MQASGIVVLNSQNLIVGDKRNTFRGGRGPEEGQGDPRGGGGGGGWED